jgi:hypothetical protein
MPKGVRRIKPEISKKPTSVEAVESTNEDQGIVEPTLIIEEPKEVSLGLVDRSALVDRDKLMTVINLLKVLPKQYQETEATIKQNIWNIARFEPTNAMIQQAREAIENEPKRDQR